MNIKEFRAELGHKFAAAGLELKVAPRSKVRVWVLPGREVERRFWEHSMKRPWGFLLSGVLAVDVPAFRTWLTDEFPLHQHGVLRNNLLSRHVANEPDMFLGAEDGKPPFADWAKMITVRLAALPDTTEGLLRAECEPERLRLVWDNHTAPHAWSYFKAWAARNEPKSPPPFMLSDGQIVAAANNDSV